MLEEAERASSAARQKALGVAVGGRETERDNRKAKARKGSVPGRMKPRRARDAARGEIQRRCAPTGRGMKPLKRGRCGSNA